MRIKNTVTSQDCTGRDSMRSEDDDGDGCIPSAHSKHGRGASKVCKYQSRAKVMQSRRDTRELTAIERMGFAIAFGVAN